MGISKPVGAPVIPVGVVRLPLDGMVKSVGMVAVIATTGIVSAGGVSGAAAISGAGGVPGAAASPREGTTNARNMAMPSTVSMSFRLRSISTRD